MSKTGLKIKRSFSISPESDAFLRQTRQERGTASESETLDLLLSELRNLHARRAIEAAYSDFYGSLGDAEVEEQRAWGSFSESQRSAEDPEPWQ